MTTENVSQQIDLEEIVRSKAGKNARYIPGFLIGWMKKFIHQDFINDYLKQGYKEIDFCENCLAYLNVNVEVEGQENLDTGGGKRYTFVSNHPLGAIDGVTLGMVLGRMFDGNIKYLLNDFLMFLKGLAPLGIPINKLGGQTRNLPRLIDEAFHSDTQMILFPAGLCSRKIDGKIQDIAWSKAFVSKSIATKRDIVPIHFIGHNSKRFYRIASWQKRLGIRFNIAMMFLPDEMYRAQGGTYKVIIGKPIPWQSLDNSKTHYEWAQDIREKVYGL